MKTGRTITEIAKELERQRETRKDFIAPANMLRIDATEDKRLVVAGLNGSTVGITDIAHGQVSAETRIPKPYYDRMRNEAPHLLAANVNEWFGRDDRKRLVRVLDGNMRAFLSDRYRRLDYFDLAEVSFPVLQEGGAEIVSCELTERRLYIKAIFPSLSAEIPESTRKGEIVNAGVVISNSEVGLGQISIEPMIWEKVCENGMIAETSRLKKRHVGRGHDFEDVQELLSDQTKTASDAAFWLVVRDVIRASKDEVFFKALVQKMKLATQDKIESDDIAKVVEVTAAKFTLPETVNHGILKHLIQGGDLSRFGLINAVTRTSQDVESYDDATELERVGGKILELPAVDWTSISRAQAA